MTPRNSLSATLSTRRGLVSLILFVVLLLAGVAALVVVLVDRAGSPRNGLRIYDPGAGAPLPVGDSDIVSDSVGVTDNVDGWHVYFRLTPRGAERMQAVTDALSRAARAGHARAARLAFGGRVYDQARVAFQPAPPAAGAAAVIQVGGLTCPAAQRLATTIRGGPVANRVPCVVRSPAPRLTRVPAKAVAAGSSYSCALTRPGAVECWGDNHFGQLGNGTISSPNQATPQPVPIDGLRRGVLSVSTGAQAACALLSSRRVECWGYGASGQLGGTGRNSRPVPKPIAGVRGARALAVADTHACAALARQAVDCWGLDDEGQLGDGKVTHGPRLARVEGLRGGIRTLAAGGLHTCAITTLGRAFCWGFNGSGQLGDGTRHGRARPVAVVGLDGGVAEIAAGGLHTCALTARGAVECWGSNTSGEIGGGGKESLKARPVNGLPKATAIAVGDSQSCAVARAGAVYCWGSNGDGQTGDSRRRRGVPVEIRGLAGRVVALAVGSSHTCALLRGGSVECWGQDDQGQLGDGRPGPPRPRPVRVVGLGG